jgi:hypothetical protein
MSHITITWHGDQFNVELASKEGAEAFLSVKGCRIVDGTKGPFVSYPATKNTNTGKWWSHCWGSDAFNAVVLSKAQAGMPKAPARATARAASTPDDSEPPF